MRKISLLSIFIMLTSSAAFGQFQFIENAEERGIDFKQQNGSLKKNYIVEAKGAGVAVADINGDGWGDIYLVNGADVTGKVDASSPRNQLYLNKGDGTFRNATEASGLGDAGFGTGAFFADIDNDGDLDCYLTNFGPNQLYINNGSGKFNKVENAGGAQNHGWSTGAAFADINGDGLLDLYVGQYAVFTTAIADKKGTLAPFHGHMAFIGPSAYKPADDNLFLNNGDGTFKDVTKERGINSFSAGRAFTITFTDLDNDRDLDIYIANDTTSNHLYENDGQGFFDEVSLIAGVGLSDAGKEQGGMGVAVRDIDGDLDLDIAVANYHKEYNILYRNEGDLQFVDATFITGVGQGTPPKVSFGMLLEDFNNDVWPDVFVSAGHVYPLADELKFLNGYAQKNLLMHNKGQGRFVDVSDKIGPASKLTGVSRGCAVGDFDRDGDLDIVINNLDGAPFFLENQSKCGNWIQIAVQNDKAMPAYGARVELDAASGKQVAELYSSHSFLSQNSADIHFGLGDAETISAIRIRWPDGKEKVLENINVNQRLVVRPSE